MSADDRHRGEEVVGQAGQATAGAPATSGTPDDGHCPRREERDLESLHAAASDPSSAAEILTPGRIFRSVIGRFDSPGCGALARGGW